MPDKKPLIILVHPASLCGSYQTRHDYHHGWKAYARAQRQIICNKFQNFPGHRIAVLGKDYDDEIPIYPEVHEAVITAHTTYTALSDEESLIKNAAKIWKNHGQTASSILVTGAWCDEETGCTWTIFNQLQKLAEHKIEVILDNDGARESDIDHVDT